MPNTTNKVHYEQLSKATDEFKLLVQSPESQ